MMKVRKSKDRGQGDHGWLQSFHSFSFADYYDPNHMGFGALQVINEDFIAAGYGFPTHPHQHMEIITYVVEGALEHKDSMGNNAVINPGEVQRMSAGSGVRHSEFNPSKVQPTHLLQIWIHPDGKHYQPGYEQKSFAVALKTEPFKLVASNHGREGSVSLNQDVDLYVSQSTHALEKDYQMRPQRSAWLQLIDGHIELEFKDEKVQLSPGDAAALVGPGDLKMKTKPGSHLLFFDLPLDR